MRALLVILLSVVLIGLAAESGSAQTYSDYALIRKKIIVEPEEIWEINKSLANEYLDVDLFSYPKSGVFVFDWNATNNSLRSSLMLAVDPDWNRLVYTGHSESRIRAIGFFGSGPNQYKWPQSVTAHAISDGSISEGFYDIYVADTYNDRICQLIYTPALSQMAGGVTMTENGLWCPIDVTIDDGDTYRPNTDDEIWVLNGNNDMLGFTYNGGFIGSVDLPDDCVASALVYSHFDPIFDPLIYVADTANDKIYRYYYSSAQGTYIKDVLEGIATSSVVDLQVDSYYCLWALDQSGVFTKYGYALSILCHYYVDSQFQSPSSFSIACGAAGSADLFISEEWTSSSGIQHFVIGTDIIDNHVTSNPENTSHSINYTLVDASIMDVALYEYNDFNAKVRTFNESNFKLAGQKFHAWDGRDDSGDPVPAGDYTYRVRATSTYGDAETGVPVNVAERTGTVSHNTSQTCCLIRGDINHSGSPVPDIADMVYLVNYMYNDGPNPLCLPETDVNADSSMADIGDLVYLVNYMFNGGPAPAPCP